MNPKNSSQYDLIIVGGGAAGLMACASAIRSGKNVLLLEKNRKLGVKILMSGGTRCNITHNCDSQGIVDAFGNSGRFLYSALAALSPADVVAEIESAGVATKIESTGKIFPVSDSAVDVRDALVDLATSHSYAGTSRIIAGNACTNICKVDEFFHVATSNDTFVSKAVLITTGGKSYPQCGTNGDGYAWAKHFGHRIERPVAALTPIKNTDCWSHELKGITLEDVAISIQDVHDEKQRPLDRRRGGFLFTHFGFSGPAPLNISRTISLHERPDSTLLFCDFVPDQNDEQLKAWLTQLLSQNPKQSLGNSLCQKYPRRFVELVLQQHGFEFSKKSAEVSKKSVSALTATLKRMQFPIDGVYGFAKAEVTAGGVSLDEINSSTMQSKLCPGLYFAGEVIDLDGPIGGYNFQAAFSTGWLAGMNA